MAAVIALNPVSHGPGLAGRRELTSWGGYAHRLAEWEGRIPLVREPADIRILVAGGPG
jgi:hypothetical protein